MKILLSAYACSASWGSEPAMGWNWASRLARAGHEVWVITASWGREKNEQASTREGLRENLHFVYYDHSRFPKFFCRTYLGDYIYMQSWQVGAYALARRLHRRRHFDSVHHVTVGTVRIGSLMWRLGIPFTFGPLAGGERIPWRLRRSLPATGKFRELVRDASNFCLRFSPITHSSFREAAQILVTNADTLQLIPARYRTKCKIQLAIGLDVESCEPAKRANRTADEFKALYVGVLDARKGIHLALRAFASFQRSFPHAEFTIVGDGPAEAWLHNLAAELKLGECVRWVSWVPRDEVLGMYGSYDVFLFPSLRDSGGFVVLEALARGLPVICLDLGGPGIMVDDSCGRVIATNRATEGGLVDAIAQQLSTLAANPALRLRLSEGAMRRAQKFCWDDVISSVYGSTGKRVIQCH